MIMLAKIIKRGNFSFVYLKKNVLLPSEIFVQWLKLTYLSLMNSRSSRLKNDMKKNYELQYTSKYSVKIQSYGTSAVKVSLFFSWYRDRNRYRKNTSLRRVPLNLTRHLKSHTTHRQHSREEKSQFYIYHYCKSTKRRNYLPKLRYEPRTGSMFVFVISNSCEVHIIMSKDSIGSPN